MSATRTRVAALLAPGASATRDHSALVAIDKALADLGVRVERIDLPGTRAPANVKAIADAAAALHVKRVILGGRSMGGRMCSMAVAQGAVPNAAGLVLVSYPLHPPGRPDKQPDRTAHFPDLDLPCLFVSGTRDAFGTPAELTAATKAIPGPVEHIWVEGGDHGLRGKDAEVAAAVAAWATDKIRD